MVRKMLKKSVNRNQTGGDIDMKIGIVSTLIMLLLTPMTVGAEDIISAGKKIQLEV